MACEQHCGSLLQMHMERSTAPQVVMRRAQTHVQLKQPQTTADLCLCRPYLLPCLAAGCVSLMALSSSLFLLPETLPRIVNQRYIQLSTSGADDDCGENFSEPQKHDSEQDAIQGITCALVTFADSFPSHSISALKCLCCLHQVLVTQDTASDSCVAANGMLRHVMSSQPIGFKGIYRCGLQA